MKSVSNMTYGTMWTLRVCNVNHIATLCSNLLNWNATLTIRLLQLLKNIFYYVTAPQLSLRHTPPFFTFHWRKRTLWYFDSWGLLTSFNRKLNETPPLHHHWYSAKKVWQTSIKPKINASFHLFNSLNTNEEFYTSTNTRYF